MRFFAESFNNSGWRSQLGCLGMLFLSLLPVVAVVGGLVAFGYWLGAR